MILACVTSLQLLADETCDEALREAKQKYNSGQYQKAKELFQFVQGECGTIYGSADSWVQKCNTALSPSSSSTKNSSKSTSNSGTNTTKSTSAKTLYVDQSTFNVSASAQTKYVTVTSNGTWELANTSSSLFTVTKSGNTVTISVKTNTTTSSRSDYFDIQLTDKSKSIRINVYQAAGSSSSSNSSSSSSGTSKNTSTSSSYSSRTTYQSPYRQYINSRGVFEVTWYSMRAGIGTGIAYNPSLFKLRLGPVQLSPLEFSVGYDFLRGDLKANYQPTIDAFIPLASNHAIYAGVGPVVDLYKNNHWFKLEAGWHLHWGRSASSDFFARYDGAFVVGASIQWSTGW